MCGDPGIGKSRLVAGLVDRIAPEQLFGPGVVIDVKEPACSFEVMNPGRATGVVAMPLVIELDPPGGNAPHA